MKTTAISFVRRLVELSCDAGGEPSVARVRAVLQVLAESMKPARLRPLLRRYLAALGRALAAGEARIESASPLPPEIAESVAAALSRSRGRRLTPRVAVNPALIGGMRARVGDDVYDATISAVLARLATCPAPAIPV
ncbi:MAG: F0F1 ATP synthase subunit delta [Puniceicoccales bacterium]|nr:F0F1 ATP synthase subunit delta [Puniceicoccales bacterium]